MQYGYDPRSGLHLPSNLLGSGRSGNAPPNPDREPPLDPFWQHEVRRLGERFGKRYQWYWMKDMHIWGIQVYLGGGQWQTVFAWYDEETAWKGNPYPFLPPDARAMEEFCRADLGIRYGTGDHVKDEQLRQADADTAKAATKAANDKQQAEFMENAMTGGDPKRFQRLMQHESAHGGDGMTASGVRFQEYFRGFGEGKKGGG